MKSSVMATAATSPYNITVICQNDTTHNRLDDALLKGRDMVNLPGQTRFVMKSLPRWTSYCNVNARA